MRASVVVRTKDEAGRLSLTLASLARQSEPAEIIIVNDGSADHTSTVIEEAEAASRIIHINHATPRGRSTAANAGAAQAADEILIFLDGDTLAAPDFVASHLRVHRQHPGQPGALVVRGETWHLRCTRFLADPETGSPQPGQETRLARMSAAERTRMRVTRRDIAENFAAVEARGNPGIYPGAGPRLLYELEMAALQNHPDCAVLWAAASGANQSVGRAAFLAAGGFNPMLSINEHRELALRLCKGGARMAPASARSYHLTHRSGWRDPLADSSWEPIFFHAHPIAAVALLPVLWASLSESVPFAESSRINSLPQLAQAADRCRSAHSAEAVRRMHFDSTGAVTSMAS